MTAAERDLVRATIEDLAHRHDPMRERGNTRGKVALLLTNGATLVGWPEIVGDPSDGNLVRLGGLTGARDEALVPLSSVVAVTWGEVAS